MFADMITQGLHTLDMLDAQFAAGFHPDNWKAIRDVIDEKLKGE